jgi:hypothetical protein
LVEVYDDVGEDAEEVEGNEAEDCPVLRARGEELRNAGLAAGVEGFEAGAARVLGFVVPVHWMVSCGLVVQEGLGRGDIGGGVGGGHSEGGYCCSRTELVSHTLNGLERGRGLNDVSYHRWRRWFRLVLDGEREREEVGKLQELGNLVLWSKEA